ncbi:MAG: choice-of-anchor Q domain-containing protein, partial [Candidatus Dojkabacteria bacterium]|nr:choice-of-anchor Q domain-containing protein [Candidatus Dojkabacteria bacterium]
MLYFRKLRLYLVYSVVFALILLFFLIIFRQEARAATYCDGNPEGNCYVDGSVASSGDGKTPSTAFRTIQEAADVVGPGDTVNVRGGNTYTDSNDCSGYLSVVCIKSGGTTGNPVTFRTWPGTGAPIIDAVPVDSGFSSFGFDYITLNGFVINNDSDTYQYGIRFSSENIQIINNTFNGTWGAVYSYSMSPTSAVIVGNTFTNNYYGITLYPVAGGGPFTTFEISENTISGSQFSVFLGDVEELYFFENHIYNSSEGIHGDYQLTTPVNYSINNNMIYTSKNGIVLIFFNASGANSVELFNNSIVGQISGSSTGTSFLLVGTTQGIFSMRNNIIFRFDKGQHVWNVSSSTVDTNYNLVYGNILNYEGLTAGSNDINTSPVFFDDSSDFRLQPSSPAIDAGATLSEVTDDIIGIPRPQGSAYDIGAYEYYDIPVTLDSET